MGYNSFGNVLFFGIGVYVCADRPDRTVLRCRRLYGGARRRQRFAFDAGQYFTGLASAWPRRRCRGVAALVLGLALLGLRGHYFAIATLGLGIAAGELAAGWTCIGAGSGMRRAGLSRQRSTSAPPSVYYLALGARPSPPSLTLRWLYTTRFGLALNAIRDDEDKAEAMGPATRRATRSPPGASPPLFLGLAGGLVGNIIGFIDPREVAFAGATFGVWMVLMAMLGGKGTLWGPVIGAVVFHVTQGAVLDLSARLAERGAGRADRRRRGVLPGRHPGLGARAAAAPRCRRGVDGAAG